MHGEGKEIDPPFGKSIVRPLLGFGSCTTPDCGENSIWNPEEGGNDI
ncbi:hypothetical protein MYX76_00620 [Desulfobacterota bacterium AH_259_B03_O07]|nr:hypothetical protein [Desulfobacterota bacterium AH_259_B03_O07]